MRHLKRCDLDLAPSARVFYHGIWRMKQAPLAIDIVRHTYVSIERMGYHPDILSDWVHSEEDSNWPCMKL